jgi:uncharacterized protein RhaS with RHS repeats
VTDWPLPDDPELGRFTQMDPKWKVYAGLSPYQYAANNPLRNIDPDGRYILDAQLARNTRVVNLFKELQWFAHATPSVHAAFGQLNTKVSDFADFGVGPKVVSVKGMFGAGKYPKNMGSDLQSIEISQTLIDNLSMATTHEEIQFWKGVIVWTILHETGHWAWLTNRMEIRKEVGESIDLPKEPSEYLYEVGDWTETQIWGENRTWDTSIEFDPEKDQLWDIWDASTQRP